MKDFLVYTAMRLVLFVGALLIVGGIWALVTGDTQVPALAVLLIALLISGVASLVLLNPQREAFARRVEQRAGTAVKNFESRRAKEDGVDPSTGSDATSER